MVIIGMKATCTDCCESTADPTVTSAFESPTEKEQGMQTIIHNE